MIASRRRTRHLLAARGLRAVIVSVYLAALLFAPGIETAIERGAHQPTHIEAESDTPCSLGHSEFLCPTCRFTELSGSCGYRVAIVIGSTPLVRVTTDTWSFVKLSSSGLAAHGQRAPPLLLS